MRRTTVSQASCLAGNSELKANNSYAEINNAADQAGVPQQDDKMVDDVADKKINNDVPGGN